MSGRRWAGLAVVALWALPATALGQSAQVDTGGPPGVPVGGSRLGRSPGDPNAGSAIGPALGASGTSSFDVLQGGGPISGRLGPSASRAPAAIFAPPAPNLMAAPAFRPAPSQPVTLPNYGSIEETGLADDPGPPDGLTLDAAIERYVRNNLNIVAYRFEIPMAEADVLTASLRNNPIFYADSQLVPYGQYSNSRPGGPLQFDVNITIPLDVNNKRRARILVAQRAKRATQAQLQDAIRQGIDNLYTIYVDVQAARQNLVISQAGLKNIQELERQTWERFKRGDVTRGTYDAVVVRLRQTDLQVRESIQKLAQARRALAIQLNILPSQADQLRLRASLKDQRPLPMTPDKLTETALNVRPDLMAVRLGIGRAQADVALAQRNRFQDVYVLVQPYTFQNNQPFGTKSATSYAIGLTANLPILNRNQGNISRAQYNVRQTRVEYEALARQVVLDVDGAVREYQLSLDAAVEYERRIVPGQRSALAEVQKNREAGTVSIGDYLDALKDFNEVYRAYRDALVRYRRAALDLNTAVGIRIVP
jgi:cobalt-zinc-cadmium efflux system outer membrane protein